MREAIGGTWLFQIVIVFILLFTGYMCLTINSSKAFNVKNMIVNEIERANGIDLGSQAPDEATIQKIANYMKDTSYRTEGKCSTGATGYDRNGNKNNNNAAFCITETITPNSGGDLPAMRYYHVEVFYQLDLPIFNQMFNFKTTGDTKILSTSFSKSGYYMTENSMCQQYKAGKKVGSPKKCSDVNQSQIVKP